MLLTLTTTANNATDLGYLLFKNPANLFHREAWFGNVYVFYTEVSAERTTAALLMQVDPIGLVRGSSISLDQYVNDRPYVASSLMSVALVTAFRSAMNGQGGELQYRVEEPLPLEATLSAVNCDAGPDLVHRLFEPLGYQVHTQALEASLSEGTDHKARLFSLRFEASITVKELLAHLYVLMPVIDNAKHYFIGEEEADKLLRYGVGWLANHPEKELITRRYLRYRKQLVRVALDQLRTEETIPDDDRQEAEEVALEKPVRLNDARLKNVVAAIVNSGAKTVLDLGCGEGSLLALLLKQSSIKSILGVDVSPVALERAERNLKFDRLTPLKRERIRLAQGSAVYRDDRFLGFDCAAVVEVIEHLDPPRLRSFEKTLFGHAKPGRAIITTPNAEYNAMWETLPAGKFRHRDHRFEWTRDEFTAWGNRVAQTFDYDVKYEGIGDISPEHGTPTQMAIFDKRT